MEMNALRSILRQAARLDRLPVMLQKAWRRLGDDRGRLSPEQNRRWLAEQKTDFEAYARAQDAALWEETLAYAARFDAHAARVLSSLEVKLGGGGYVHCLYFLTRFLRPRCVVETGVAAGHSSNAFLAALEANGGGRLFSSDFPYFRIEDPERYIGVVVEDRLRAGWTLLVDGDERNLPRIVAQVDRIDLFHYDSDKSYAGRRRALALVAPKLASGSVVVMDDIQDNSFFHDLVTSRPCRWQVFEAGTKFVGLVTALERPGA